MFSFRPNLEYCERALGVEHFEADRKGVMNETDQLAMDLLMSRADLYSENGQWDELLPLARDIVALQPEDPHGWIHWAQSCRKLGRVNEAKAVLLRAERVHPVCAVIDYNLACYDTLLGHLSEAYRRLARACEIAPKWRTVAVCDPDLKDIGVLSFSTV